MVSTGINTICLIAEKRVRRFWGGGLQDVFRTTISPPYKFHRHGNRTTLFPTVLPCTVNVQSYKPTRLVRWTIFVILPRGGEGCRAVRTGSSMVTDTPDFC